MNLFKCLNNNFRYIILQIIHIIIGLLNASIRLTFFIFFEFVAPKILMLFLDEFTKIIVILSNAPFSKFARELCFDLLI